jgi:hypothetical protein
VDYPTQYAGMMGSAPDRIEIDTSDGEMGADWHAQLEALDAQLDALAQDVERGERTHQQGHAQGW